MFGDEEIQEGFGVGFGAQTSSEVVRDALGVKSETSRVDGATPPGRVDKGRRRVDARKPDSVAPSVSGAGTIRIPYAPRYKGVP